MRTKSDIYDDKATNSLITYSELDKYAEDIPDIPQNQKLKKLLKSLSIVFRYKYEKEKAESSVYFWQESQRQAFLKTREIISPKKKKKKTPPAPC